MDVSVFFRRKRGGTTLIETLVYALLFLLVLTCIYFVTTAIMKYFVMADWAVDVHQSAMVAVTKLSHELSCARPVITMVKVDPLDPSAIIFAYPKRVTINGNQLIGNVNIPAAATSYDSDATLLWDRLICYYVDVDDKQVSCLMRKEWPITGGPVTDPDISTYLGHETALGFKNDATLERKVVARHIDSMTFATSFSTSTLNGSVAIELVASKMPPPPMDPSKRYSLTLRTQVKLRN
jgi:hypothetical protein